MERNEHAVEIAAPRARVFAWLTEPELMLRWIGGLQAFRPLDPEPGPGARAEQVVELGGRRMEVRSEITRFEQDDAVEARLTGKGFEVATAYELEPAGDATRVRATVHTRLHGLGGRLLGGVVERGAQRKLERDLARLKELAEQDAAA
ncbi:MAG TPA: SRPBCC family protein [Gaiellaceae bacterium]|nr:SRPBCC family protein [Gaiellaceae bacterium]